MGVLTWLFVWLSCIFGLDCKTVQDIPNDRIKEVREKIPYQYREKLPGIVTEQEIAN